MPLKENGDPSICQKKVLIFSIILVSIIFIFYLSKSSSILFVSGLENNTATVTLNIAEKTNARIQAQIFLAQALTLSDKIRHLNPDKWAKTAFFGIEASIAEGEKYYRRGAYRAAQKNYQRAIRDAEKLAQTIPMVVEQNNLTGDLAIFKKDATEAMFSYSLVLKIDPANEHAKNGLVRSQSLDKVNTLIMEGVRYEKLGEIDAAIAKYSEVATLDPENPALESSKQRIKFEQRQQRYREKMSQGFSSLKNLSFSEAKILFEDAQRKNNSSEVKMALRQATNGLANQAIKSLIERGHDASKKEEWEQAATFYKRAVDKDSALANIAVLATEAKGRSTLDREIENTLSLPLGISLSDGYDNATATLQRAEAISLKGRRLSGQIMKLKHEIKLAEIPIDIIIKSDNVAFVKIHPNSNIGKFKRITLSLLPGEYLIEGHCDDGDGFQKKITVSHVFLQKEQELIAECHQNPAQ